MDGRPALMTYGSAALLGLLAVVALGVPELRMWAVGLVIAGLCWFLLLPRGWFQRLDLPTRNVVIAFLIVRLLMPFIFIGIGSLADSLFSGGFDSATYTNAGTQIADQLTSGSAVTAQREVPGTGAVDLAVGYAYWVGAPDRMAGSLLFSTGATLGLLLFWLATKELVGRRQWQYAASVLLLPTLLFWNAGIGKEAPLVLGTGLAVMALHLILERGAISRGLVYLALGVTVTAYVRPHIAFLLVTSAAVGVLLASRRASGAGTGRRLLALTATIAAVLITIPVTLILINPSGDKSFFDAAYETTERNAELYDPSKADAGRSSFETDAVRGPLDIPRAFVTVLFRPYPWEVSTPMQLLASAEATTLGIVTLVVVWRLAIRRYSFRRHPLIITAVTFTVLFSAAFVSAGNFGLLVRQRMQVVGFLVFILFAVMASERSSRAVHASPVDELQLPAGGQRAQ